MIEEDKLTSAVAQLSDEEFYNSIRPKQLDDYIGQQKVREQMSIFITAAQQRSEP